MSRYGVVGNITYRVASPPQRRLIGDTDMLGGAEIVLHDIHIFVTAALVPATLVALHGDTVIQTHPRACHGCDEVRRLAKVLKSPAVRLEMWWLEWLVIKRVDSISKNDLLINERLREGKNMFVLSKSWRGVVKIGNFKAGGGGQNTVHFIPET